MGPSTPFALGPRAGGTRPRPDPVPVSPGGGGGDEETERPVRSCDLERGGCTGPWGMPRAPQKEDVGCLQESISGGRELGAHTGRGCHRDGGGRAHALGELGPVI